MFWFGVLSKKFIMFWYSIIILLYYYINLRSLTIFCLFFWDIYLSLSISVSLPTVSEVFCGEFLKTFVILLVIFLPIKLPVASAAFWINYSDAVLRTSKADCLPWLRSFWLYLPLMFIFIFTNIFAHILSKRKKSIALWKFFISRFNWITIEFFMLHFH